MAGKAIKCSACGAPLPDPDGSPHLTCRFCGTANTVGQKPQRERRGHVVEVRFDARGASQAAQDVAKTAGKVAVAATVVPLFATLAIGGFVAFMTMRSHKAASGGLPAVELPSFGGGAGLPGLKKNVEPDLARGPANFAWQDQYVCPLGVDANGDGVEDLAGPFALEENGELRSYAGVLDGKTFQILWKAGPYGLRDKLRRKVGAAVSNGKLVVLEGGVKIHVHDLATGKELASADTNAEESRFVCAPGKDAPVFVGSPWGGGQLVDTKAVKIQSGGAPTACRRTGLGGARFLDDTGDVRHVRGATNVRPNLPAMEIKEALAEGAIGVAVASPRADKGLSVVGFDPKTKAMRWTRAASDLGLDGDGLDLVDVGDGRVYLQAPTKLGPTLVALDGLTGATRWATPSSSSSVFNVTVDAQRVYVVRGDWPNLPVEVFDVATGKKLARLGKGRDDG